jgi:hypothetical protein
MITDLGARSDSQHFKVARAALAKAYIAEQRARENWVGPEDIEMNHTYADRVARELLRAGWKVVKAT